MKKVIAFSLIVLLASPIFVGCKGGSSCFTRNGSRVPTSCPLSSAYADPASDSADGSAVAAAAGPRIINATEAPVMMANSAYSNCAPCAPTACNPCDPCTPCNPCSGQGNPGYTPTTAATAYQGM